MAPNVLIAPPTEFAVVLRNSKNKNEYYVELYNNTNSIIVIRGSVIYAQTYVNWNTIDV